MDIKTKVCKTQPYNNIEWNCDKVFSLLMYWDEAGDK